VLVAYQTQSIRFSLFRFSERLGILNSDSLSSLELILFWMRFLRIRAASFSKSCRATTLGTLDIPGNSLTSCRGDNVVYMDHFSQSIFSNSNLRPQERIFGHDQLRPCTYNRHEVCSTSGNPISCQLLVIQKSSAMTSASMCILDELYALNYAYPNNGNLEIDQSGSF